jgi:hypothetical protein
MAKPETSLSTSQIGRLWKIAQHKYGWGHYGWRDWPSYAALERRGLVRLVHTAGDCRTYELTDEGLAECARRFPVSPAVLKTYDPQPGGWTPRKGVAT